VEILDHHHIGDVQTTVQLPSIPWARRRDRALSGETGWSRQATAVLLAAILSDTVVATHRRRRSATIEPYAPGRDFWSVEAERVR